MSIKEFIEKTGHFTNCTYAPIMKWKGFNVYKVWNELNGKPVPTGPPFYLLEDSRGNFRYTEVEEGFEILRISQERR